MMTQKEVVIRSGDVKKDSRKREIDNRKPAPEPRVGRHKLTSQQQDSFNKMLFKSVEKGRHNDAARWLKHGANPNFLNERGITPLMHAVSVNNSEMAVLLLANGALANVEDKRGSTALHMAATNGSVAMVMLLLGKNASIEIINKDRETPIAVAERCSRHLRDKFRQPESIFPKPNEFDVFADFKKVLELMREKQNEQKQSGEEKRNEPKRNEGKAE